MSPIGNMNRKSILAGFLTILVLLSVSTTIHYVNTQSTTHLSSFEGTIEIIGDEVKFFETAKLINGQEVELIIHVLNTSHSSINFDWLQPRLIGYEWIPPVEDFVLAPEETYQKVFYLEADEDLELGIHYSCSLVDNTSDATFTYQYSIREAQTTPNLSFEFILSFLIIASTAILLKFFRWKKKKE